MTSPKRQSKAAAVGGPVVTVPENVNEFYANVLQIALSPWDISLMFGSIKMPSGPPGMGTQEAVIDTIIKMSPQHAKAVLRSLTQVMAEYEREYGEIRLPPEAK